MCGPGSTEACYTGPSGTQGVGACKSGLKTCLMDGSGYGPCVGQVTPVAESCITAADDDCDGQANEQDAGCVCTPGATQTCYDGPSGTVGVGICVSGQKTCASDGKSFGACAGQVLPANESCSTPVDDNCNGQVNEGCAAPVTYTNDVKPILLQHCSPCHSTGGSGGANLATSYASTQLASYACAGKTKGECALVRAQNGSMPPGAGCTGDPTKDAGNPKCLTAAEQQTLQAWIAAGQPQ